MTRHFSKAELTRSAFAILNRINNTPSPGELANLKHTAWQLEVVRALLGGKYVFISSGFRSAKVNEGVGGSNTSDHMNGFAVDFKIYNGKSTSDNAAIITKSGLYFDQLIVYNQFIHISFNPRYRKEVIYKI